MTIYLDSSALVKLVVHEPESEVLRGFLRGRPDARTTSALSRTEVVRAAGRFRAESVVAARDMLDALHDVAVSRSLLDAAADIALRVRVRTLDAIHLATAQSLRQHLDVLVTYDRRMADAALELGLPVATPT